MTTVDLGSLFFYVLVFYTAWKVGTIEEKLKEHHNKVERYLEHLERKFVLEEKKHE